MSLKNFHLKVNDELELKVPVIEDAQALINLVNSSRESLEKYMDWAPKTKTIEDVILFIRSNLHLSIYDKDFPLAIWYQGKLVGISGYNLGNKLINTVDIGYWIADEYTGKGIVTKVCQALINFAFSMTEVKSIYLKCEISNTKSYAVANRLNFVFKSEKEGECYIKDGKPVMVTYVLHKRIN